MSFEDDDSTPPRNPKLWGDTQRSSSAAERRRREEASRKQRETEPITDTVLLIDREEMSQAEREVVRRVKRPSSDTATVADIVKLAVARSRGQDQDADVAGIKRDMKILRVVGGALLTLVLGSAVWTIERMWSFAELVGITTIRLQHIEEMNLRLYQEIRDVRKDSK